MTQAKQGDKVTIHYTGKLSDGSIFDSTVGNDPLVFQLGGGELIDGLEEGVTGMVTGEKKILTISPEKAYGERTDELVIEVPLENFPVDLDFQVGDELEVTDKDGEVVPVRVCGLTEETITLDGNFPLAGETLTFDIELIKVEQG